MNAKRQILDGERHVTPQRGHHAQSVASANRVAGKFSATGRSAQGGTTPQVWWPLGARGRRGGTKTTPRAAFTLVELMVVLAIVAMLAGFLANYIREGRERARTTYCRNNLRQFGVAIGKYESDWSGYFIRPSSFGTAEKMAHGTGLYAAASSQRIIFRRSETGEGLGDIFDYGKEADAIQGSGGTVAALGDVGSDSYNNFLTDYVDAEDTDKNVKVCPEVDMTIYETNNLNFKGKRYEPTYCYYYENSVAQKTSYAINDNVDGMLRSQLKDNVFAFIDWNAVNGWSPAVSWGTSRWYMAKETIGLAVKNTIYKDCGGFATCPLKNSPMYLTDIGFHHRSGTNLIANYVAMDGHVGSVVSNAPSAEFHALFYGN